ncbi:MAG: hypothetical protein QM619_03565 [Micropruina sp.]|uniref:hypothetical protein n=1 Tax=Micropruina sp. TaxID=2737536 RepID=UPI0039E47745
MADNEKDSEDRPDDGSPSRPDNGIEGRPPDPFVAARINDPSAPAPASLQLAGLLGDSERAGYRRLYLNTALDYYVEFRTDDVLAVDSVAPDQPPFVGLDATRVTLKRDAQVAYVHSRPAAAVSDAFDVDAQTDGSTAEIIRPTTTVFTRTRGVGCVPNTLPPGCQPATIPNTCGPGCDTLHTLRLTQCGTCGDATCQTCNQATCVSCVTCDNGVSCQTCVAGECWPTLGGTCITCRITICNWNCQPSAVVRCVTQDGCPTLACP